MLKNTVCFYHSRDFDGWGSAALVNLAYPGSKLIGYDYGQKFPIEEIDKESLVVMCDVSLPMQEMFDLACYIEKFDGSFLWIDHHKSAIEKYNVFLEQQKYIPIEKVLDSKFAACELTWKYFFPFNSVPMIIELLGIYDSWRNDDKEKWNNSVMPFQFGLRAKIQSVDEMCNLIQFSRNDNDYIEKTIEDGNLILRYQENQNAIACNRAFETTFCGMKAICMNGGLFNSDAFKSVYDPQKHDMMMAFAFNGKYWTVSMYSDKPDVDCSKIAVQYGGGGHKSACGFQCKDIGQIFKEINDAKI